MNRNLEGIVKQFEKRELKRARVYNETTGKMDIVPLGYQLIKDQAGPGAKFSIYSSRGSREALSPNYTLEVDNGVFELDIVDFEIVDGVESTGVVVYSNKYGYYAVKDIESGKHFPFCKIKILRIRGNVYENPDLVTGSSDPNSAEHKEAVSAKPLLDMYLFAVPNRNGKASSGYILKSQGRTRLKNIEFESGKSPSYIYSRLMNAAYKSLNTESGGYDIILHTPSGIFKETFELVLNMGTSGLEEDKEVWEDTLKIAKLHGGMPRFVLEDAQNMGKIITEAKSAEAKNA